jgi:hypothetical protein
MFVMISVILIVFLLKVPWYPGTDLTVFSHSDASLLLVYFIAYMTASICFFFLISVLFSKGTLLHNVVIFLLVYLTHGSLVITANICQVKCSRIPLIEHPGMGQALDYQIFHFITQYL